ncbi:MAG: patatin-like phospholipase family protein [Rhodocyclaceae bacterium]|nr:patatin-like phospholipase family protein [Rhodocyclaceae bacterium]
MTAPHNALVLMGGGARTAYQVGVLDGIAEVIGERHPGNPFPILVGTSAGAINAAMLAGYAGAWREGVASMRRFWGELDSSRVYEVDRLHVALGGFRWLALLALGWLIRSRPRSLLDKSPLTETLERAIRFDDVERAIRDGDLKALAITAFSYSGGRNWTYYQAAQPLLSRIHHERRNERQTITVNHLLASSAIPFVFAAEPLWTGERQEFFGDGSMRQTDPLSPAIHLGAKKILVVGVGYHGDARYRSDNAYPSLGAVAGHSLASVFYSALDADIDQATRITQAVQMLPPEVRKAFPFQPVDILSIMPSASINQLAEEHAASFPRPIWHLLKALGGTRGAGAALTSYLLFEQPFIQALIDLGRKDALAKRAELEAFFFTPANDR